MYFDTKKKEFSKDGKLSILKNKTMKMDYVTNLHRNDNDIFDTRKKINSLSPCISKEENVENKLRVAINLSY